MTSEERILKFIGLAMRAGAVVSGFDACASEIVKGNAKLIITACDTAANTINKLLDLAMKIDGDMPDMYKFSNMADLGWAIGRPNRAIIVITDAGFAKKLIQMFETEEETIDE